MGVISKTRGTRSFPPHALTVEQILADLVSPDLCDLADPFSLSPCSQPSSSYIGGTPITAPDPIFSYTTWLQTHSQMMPSTGAGAPPPSPPSPPKKPANTPIAGAKPSAKSPGARTSSSSPPRRPRKRSCRDPSIRFPCPKCPSTFSRKDNLATHARVHTGERPYKCRFCARTFMWPSSARTHELTHQKKNQSRAAASQSSVTTLQTQTQALPRSQPPVRSLPQAQPSLEQSLSQAHRASNPSQIAPAHGQQSVQQTHGQFSSTSGIGALSVPFSTSPVTRDVKTEHVLDQGAAHPLQQHGEVAQHEQEHHHSVTSSQWSSPQQSVGSLASSAAPPSVVPMAAAEVHRSSIAFSHSENLGRVVADERGHIATGEANEPPSTLRPTPLGLGGMQAAAPAVADMDAVNAGVLATIEGFIVEAGRTGGDGVGVVGQTHVGVGEGVNPTFGANLGGMSQTELERHMDNILFPCSDPHGNNNGSGSGDGESHD